MPTLSRTRASSPTLPQPLAACSRIAPLVPEGLASAPPIRPRSAAVLAPPPAARQFPPHAPESSADTAPPPDPQATLSSRPLAGSARRIPPPRRTTKPHSLPAAQRRLPIHFALDELRHHVVRRLAKHPLLALEVIMPAGKRYRQQFSRLQKLNLPPVHFLAQRVDDRCLRVLRLQRRDHLAHSLRKIHRYRRMQSFRAFQPDVPMQHPEIRSRCRRMKRPVQPYRQRQSFQCHPDFLFRGRFPAILQRGHSPISFFS